MAEKNNVVKVRERVTVYATDKSKYYRVGDEMSVHPVLAKKLVKAGKAVEKAPK
jgi:hypothetical protein